MPEENRLNAVLCDPDIVYRTWDSPTARGRTPKAGEQEWGFQFHLEDGRSLRIWMGQECRNAFRDFIFQEEVDDAAAKLLGADDLNS